LVISIVSMHHRWSRYAKHFRDNPQDIEETLTIIPRLSAAGITFLPENDERIGVRGKHKARRSGSK